MAKTILFADDNKETRELIKIWLETAGYRVVTANDGCDAVEKAKKEKPDLAILDVTMPRMDGFTANLKLKEDDSTKDMPVIIATARVNIAHAFDKSEKSKISAFIEKPYSLEEILEAVIKTLKE